ncbi:DNA-3-methyladenine glycosylase I [Terasakiella sp. A23]|uniref:DNA-3-methyladenine glycosylase I n=1 Tax=Terasakiella sp. FCG-A23 TaxID=3080561 RepID=UPI00295386E0|nr:DNA-3-methyladenine glycosylase I [Terasakiella sp. A23]MDV7340087.1 DNA-3-methyladenine glycosylase I [Terasakiella sp. A23]
MRSFSEIRDIAINRKGEAFLNDRLINPLSAQEIAAQADDRWLSAATKCIFQAGFNWGIIDKKWPEFETAFDGFDLFRNRMMSDEEIDTIMSQKKVVANYVKIKTVRENAGYFLDLVDEHSSLGSFFASWKPQDYCLNILQMRKAGSRLGGNTGLIFLRRMGVDAFIFSDDVVKGLAREGIIDKAPTSKKALKSVQGALNKWQEETSLPLNHLSQILAYSVD